MKNLAEKILKEKIWNISTDLGDVNQTPEICGSTYEIKTDNYEVFSKYNEVNGVFEYSGEFKNISDKEIIINSLMARFMLPDGNYEVYTQYNGWQNENTGDWQKLITNVSAKTVTTRTTNNATPFMALWNKHLNKGIVFHLMADYAWEISATVVSESEKSHIELKIGVNPENLLYKLEKGEQISTPEILFYEFENKKDLDAYKLHNYFNKKYKRKQMPVIFNTWLYKFDRISYENVFEQIEYASKIGVEYFVIDAGWFGKEERWGMSRGDWSENLVFGFKGRMAEISEEVRKNNMKFGLWFEIETAQDISDIANEHPEYFIHFKEQRILDFSKPEAREHIINSVSKNIEKYNIEFIKFDYNQDLFYDVTKTAYIDFNKGYRKTMDALKKKYPNVYFENCASGGYRMDLQNSKTFDSFWLSDNQSPYEGMRIFKEGIKRLPPQVIEKWAVVKTIDSLEDCDNTGEKRIISTHDATATNIVGVSPSFLNGFLTGSPIGLSCDIKRLSEKEFNILTEHIAKFKAERDFWENANCRILTDEADMLILQYSNEDLSKIKIVMYVYKTRIANLCVYPVVNEAYAYKINDEKLSGKEIRNSGIEIFVDDNYISKMLEINCE